MTDPIITYQVKGTWLTPHIKLPGVGQRERIRNEIHMKQFQAKPQAKPTIAPDSLARLVNVPSKNVPKSAPYATEAIRNPTSTTLPWPRERTASTKRISPQTIVAKRESIMRLRS